MRVKMDSIHIYLWHGERAYGVALSFRLYLSSYHFPRHSSTSAATCVGARWWYSGVYDWWIINNAVSWMHALPNLTRTQNLACIIKCIRRPILELLEIEKRRQFLLFFSIWVSSTWLCNLNWNFLSPPRFIFFSLLRAKRFFLIWIQRLCPGLGGFSDCFCCRLFLCSVSLCQNPWLQRCC